MDITDLRQVLGLAPDSATSDVDDAVSALVRESLGVTPRSGARLVPVAYESGSPATGGLVRLQGEATDGSSWSIFGKLLQHVRHWPTLAFLPPPVAAEFVAQFPWRSELELWDAPVVASLPDGLRTPQLYRVDELADDRAMVWMEDVRDDAGPWTLDRFERAASLLGRWNARSTDPALLAACPLPDDYALVKYVHGSVHARGLPMLEDDRLWSHPWLVPYADLRADLLLLGTQIDAMTTRFASFRHTMPHGDASPQNLLAPADEPGDLVVIDISFRSPHALGFDLGQLLVGLVHAGLMPAAEMPAVAAVIVPAYLQGLHAEGITDQDAAVREAFATCTLLRSGFDGIRYELLDGSSDDRAVLEQRLAMTRVLADQVLALAAAVPPRSAVAT